MTLHIGITIGLASPDESLWINGIKQNALALARTLQASSRNYKVTLVNTTAIPVSDALPWQLDQFPTANFATVEQDLDMLILLGGQLGPEQSAAMRARGVKLVGYKCGSEAVVAAETIIHGLHQSAPPYYNQHFNALWFVPQIAELNASFYQTVHRCDTVHSVPFVWDPQFLDAYCAKLPRGGVFTPPAERARRLVTAEPNRELLKTFMTPLLIAERFYRQDKEAVALFSINNIFHRREHTELLGLLQACDLFNDKKLTVEGRLDTPSLLSQYTDVVISHQWGNPLNYAYLEASWMGYPLVHNASLCKDIGFYYAGFDADAGVQALKRACQVGQARATSFDPWQKIESADAYRARQRQLIAPFLATHTANIETYDTLIDYLF